MRQITIVFFIMTLCLTSNASEEKNWRNFQLRWMSVKKIAFTEYVKTGEPVRNPPGATIVLATSILLNQKFFYEKDCLIYTIPSKKISGVLKLVNIPYKEECKNHLFSKSASYIFKNIYNLALSFQKRELVINADIKKYSFTFF